MLFLIMGWIWICTEHPLLKEHERLLLPMNWSKSTVEKRCLEHDQRHHLPSWGSKKILCIKKKDDICQMLDFKERCKVIDRYNLTEYMVVQISGIHSGMTFNLSLRTVDSVKWKQDVFSCCNPYYSRLSNHYLTKELPHPHYSLSW